MKKKTAVLDRRLQLEYRPISKLVPNTRNARTQPPEQIAKIVALINRVGFVVPVLVDEKSVILKGHGSLIAPPPSSRASSWAASATLSTWNPSGQTSGSAAGNR